MLLWSLLGGLLVLFKPYKLIGLGLLLGKLFMLFELLVVANLSVFFWRCPLVRSGFPTG